MRLELLPRKGERKTGQGCRVGMGMRTLEIRCGGGGTGVHMEGASLPAGLCFWGRKAGWGSGQEMGALTALINRSVLVARLSPAQSLPYHILVWSQSFTPPIPLSLLPHPLLPFLISHIPQEAELSGEPLAAAS